MRAILFDRDGVLTHFDLSAAAPLLAGIRGIELGQMRNDWDAWCARMAPPSNGEEERRLLASFWHSICDSYGLSSEIRARIDGFDYRRTIKAYADAEPALRWARARGLAIGVLSNFPMATLQESLEAVGLGHYVDVACAAPVIGARKPQPEAYAFALDKLGVKASECLFVDDEPECVEGGRAAGMRAIHLDRAGNSPPAPDRLRGLAELETSLAPTTPLTGLAGGSYDR